MNITYLISPTAIKCLTNISDNLSEKYITTAIRETQQVDLNQVLGDNLLVSIENMVTDGSIQDDDNRAYKTLLDNYISYFLAYGTVVKLIPIVAVKIDNAGAVQNGDEKAENISLKDMFELSGFYMQKADYYKARLQKYLREHYKDYPQLDCSSEIHSAYSSPFYLGGMRHKRVPRGHNHSSGTSAPLKKHTISYYVDNVLFTSKTYVQGAPIKYVDAPVKEGYNFNVWIYEKNGVWENLPDFMPDYDIVTYAHYIPVGGEQHYYTIRYRVADWCEDSQIGFDNMAYIPEPFEWLQCVEREYDPNTREGWAKLTHPSLRFDSEIRLQKFSGHDCLFMLDLSEFNNAYMTDRLFAENNTIREFYPPKGLVGVDGYDFYNAQYLSTINFATADGYQLYQPYSYPMTGAFSNCVSLTAILADNQQHMYSDNGNLYNSSDELIAARYGEVVIKDGCTCIKGEALKAHGLTTLTIPNSVRKIEAYAISENQNLTDVYFGGTMDEWANIEKDDVNTIFVDTQVQVIHCSDGDCPIDYSGGGGEEPAEHKIDIFIEWDYLETRWFKVGERIELPEPPHRDGYVFLEWGAIVPGGDWFTLPEFMPDYDFEVHASYAEEQPAEKQVYTLTYFNSRGAGVKTDEILKQITLNEGDVIDYFEPEVREGFTHTHWVYHRDIDESVIGNAETEMATMPAHDLEVWAYYEFNSYDVYYTLYDENGEIYFEDYVTYRYTDTINPYHPDVPEGYVFNGWEYEPATMPAHDVVVTGSITKVEPTEKPYDEQYLTIERTDNDDFNYALTYSDWTESCDMSYSVDDGATWTRFNQASNSLSMKDYRKIMFKATTNTDNTSKPKGTFKFNGGGRCIIYGNIMSLVYGDDFKGRTDLKVNYEFAYLFNQVYVTDASNLILPSTMLVKNCYNCMFQNCSHLTEPPTLPATTLADYCYSNMFYGCKALVVAPELPATKLASYCYQNMFCDCTSLTTAPVLPATTMAHSCYNNMFKRCTSLTAAPVLPATTMDASCYSSMFYGCTSLTTPPQISATTVGVKVGVFQSMFEGCTSLTKSPVLKVTSLQQSSYHSMFNSCTNLSEVTMLATSVSAKYCLSNWMNGVAETGTFYKSPNMSLETIQQHVPSGWTIEDYVA